MDVKFNYDFRIRYNKEQGDDPKPSKMKQRDKIKRDIREYIRNGGTITSLPYKAEETSRRAREDID